MIRYAAIVEGYGDVDAFPALLSRTGLLLGENLLAPRPIRAGEWKKLRSSTNLENYLDLAASRDYEKIIVFLDLDDGCAVAEAAEARSRVIAWSTGRQIDVAVSFAVREFETMFLHCIDDVAGANPSDIIAPDNIRGAKEALRPFIGRRYKETQDQVAFTKQVNLINLYERSRSYRNFCKAVSGISYEVLDAIVSSQR